MHANAALLDKLFTALREHKPLTMASCYHPKAHFRDIAFDLRGVDEIYDMWRMICRAETNIKVEFDEIEADDRAGRAMLVEDYQFGASKLNDPKSTRVTNRIESRFEFENGLIKNQIDDCDPKAWASKAMKGHPIKAFLAGRIRFVRSMGADKKLRKFLDANRE
jgi:hypothetical protein